MRGVERNRREGEREGGTEEKRRDDIMTCRKMERERKEKD